MNATKWLVIGSISCYVCIPLHATIADPCSPLGQHSIKSLNEAYRSAREKNKYSWHSELDQRVSLRGSLGCSSCDGGSAFAACSAVSWKPRSQNPARLEHMLSPHDAMHAALPLLSTGIVGQAVPTATLSRIRQQLHLLASAGVHGGHDVVRHPAGADRRRPSLRLHLAS